MRKTYKYRISPTKAQRTTLQKSLDACRWVYNKALEIRRDAWKERQESITRYATMKLIPGWKAKHRFLKNAYSQSLQETCTRVDLAFQAFFRRVKAGEVKPGYPRFKGHLRYNSFTFPQGGFNLVDKKTLRLSKIGNVKIKLHRPIEGKIKTLTIRRDRLGNWYACFSCIVKPKPLLPTGRTVGIDLGLTTFAVFSNGKKIKRQRWMKQDKKDLARVQRKVNRFSKGSCERKKSIRALQHIHQRISNRRKNFAHQESRKLVNGYDLIVFEKLDIEDMRSNKNSNKTFRKNINQGIADVAWGQFVRYTTYKAEGAGRGMVLVDPKNTTQQCSGCDEIVPKDLSVRIHDCSYCGLKIGRDLNASINILRRGLTSLSLSGVEARFFKSGNSHGTVMDVTVMRP